MKKMKYIQPQTSIVLLATRSHMLEDSSTRNRFDGESADLDPESMEEGQGGDDAASRRRNVWDVEEDGEQ